MHMDLNKIELIGRLTADPDIWVPAKTAVSVSLHLVTSRARTSASGRFSTETDLHVIVLSGKMAQVGAEYLKKGDRIYVQGRLQTVSHVAQGGARHLATEIIAESLVMLGGSREVRFAN